jgi:hypothetical protein
VTSPARRTWFCHNGKYVTAPAAAPLTMLGRYDRLVHRIWPAGLGTTSQVLTGCGRRGCVGEIGVERAVDCPECLEGV